MRFPAFLIETDMAEQPAANSPLESYNRSLVDQINDQLKRGFDASLQVNDYCVVRTGVDGVLSVMSATAVSDDQDIVSGPKSFATCIEFVNADFVKRTTPRTGVQKTRGE